MKNIKKFKKIKKHKTEIQEKEKSKKLKFEDYFPFLFLESFSKQVSCFLIYIIVGFNFLSLVGSLSQFQQDSSFLYSFPCRIGILLSLFLAISFLEQNRDLQSSKKRPQAYIKGSYSLLNTIHVFSINLNFAIELFSLFLVLYPCFWFQTRW